MEMCYRGVRYQYNQTAVPVEGKKNEVKFRGCSYTLRHAVMNVPQSSDSNIVYRGVSTATGKQIRFLGHACQHTQVMLYPVCSIGV
jgi:hypothetical protein